ncbi:hypothetical protein pb186bvf_016531 [Paramecium bursaria]
MYQFDEQMKIPLPLFVQLCTYSEENQELALCLPNFKLIKQELQFEDEIQFIIYSPKGTIFSVFLRTKLLCYWSTKNLYQKQVKTFLQGINLLAYTNEQGYMITCQYRTTLLYFNLTMRKTLRCYRFKEAMSEIVLSENRKYFSGSLIMRDEVHIWRVDNFQQIYNVETYPLSKIVYSNDYFIFWCIKGSVMILDKNFKLVSNKNMNRRISKLIVQHNNIVIFYLEQGIEILNIKQNLKQQQIVEGHYHYLANSHNTIYLEGINQLEAIKIF